MKTHKFCFSLFSAGLGAISLHTSKSHESIYGPLEIILDIQAVLQLTSSWWLNFNFGIQFQLVVLAQSCILLCFHKLTEENFSIVKQIAFYLLFKCPVLMQYQKKTPKLKERKKQTPNNEGTPNAEVANKKVPSQFDIFLRHHDFQTFFLHFQAPPSLLLQTVPISIRLS